MFAARGWRDNAEVNMQGQGETSSCAKKHAAQYGAFLLKILRAAPFQWDRIKYLDLMLKSLSSNLSMATLHIIGSGSAIASETSEHIVGTSS